MNDKAIKIEAAIPCQEIANGDATILEFDYVKDDPCYGCKFAVLKTEEQLALDGGFARRHVCSNTTRRLNHLKSMLRHCVAAENYNSARAVIDQIQNLPYEHDSRYYNVSEDVCPMCYTNEDESGSSPCEVPKFCPICGGVMPNSKALSNGSDEMFMGKEDK